MATWSLTCVQVNKRLSWVSVGQFLLTLPTFGGRKLPLWPASRRTEPESACWCRRQRWRPVWCDKRCEVSRRAPGFQTHLWHDSTIHEETKNKPTYKVKIMDLSTIKNCFPWNENNSLFVFIRRCVISDIIIIIKAIKLIFYTIVKSKYKGNKENCT